MKHTIDEAGIWSGSVANQSGGKGIDRPMSKLMVFAIGASRKIR